MPSDAYDEPLTVTPVRGAVVVGVPRGSGLAVITPEAALASAQLLTDAAKLALFGDLAPLDCDD